MRNPWLDIPLSDYEHHMALPQVAQAQLIADVFEKMLRKYSPPSVAVLGCAGGNGFERISTATTKRVVGVDLNPAYIEEVAARFRGRLPRLELIVGDVQREEVDFAPVDFVFAALLFEYVDVEAVLRRVHSRLTGGGMLGTVVQLPSGGVSTVTPTPYLSLRALGPCMRLVPPEQLAQIADRHGFLEVERWPAQALGGKHFQVQAFRCIPARAGTD